MQIVSRKEAKSLGLKRYFTGKPCLNGHVCERVAPSGVCIECRLVLDKAQREKHKAKRNASFRDWYQRNAERQRANARQYAADNSEKIKEYREKNRNLIREKSKSKRASNKEAALAYEREWREANRENARENNRRWRAKHYDRVIESERQWRQSNQESIRQSRRKYLSANKEKHYAACKKQRLTKPDQYRAYAQRRRARRAGASGAYTATDVTEIRQMQRNKCAICRVPLNKIKEHIDHIMPLALGGSNDRTNIQVLCEPCNLQKWAHHPLDHARMRGLLL